MFENVLVPTDFSEPAHNALQVLRDLEGIGEIPLPSRGNEGGDKEGDCRASGRGNNKLEKVCDDLVRAGIKTNVRIRLGRPTDEIIHLAEKEDVSLIAMSTHGKGLFEELLIGSTTHGVSIHAMHPVLVIRTQKGLKKG